MVILVKLLLRVSNLLKGLWNRGEEADEGLQDFYQRGGGGATTQIKSRWTHASTRNGVLEPLLESGANGESGVIAR